MFVSEADVVSLFAEALELDAGALQPERALTDIAEWDSIGWLTVISLLDERLGVSLSSQEIKGISTVADAARLVVSKTGGATETG